MSCVSQARVLFYVCFCPGLNIVFLFALCKLSCFSFSDWLQWELSRPLNLHFSFGFSLQNVFFLENGWGERTMGIGGSCHEILI